MEWIENLYQETEQQWQQSGSDPNGYAIFYSPIKPDSRIVIIGYNPGGGADDFVDVKVPERHEYAHQDYLLARNMRKIFHAASLEIEDTIKFNLIFFRSKHAEDVKNKELIDFSQRKVMEILDQLKPEVIIAEGFNTFEKLLELTKGKQLEIERSKANNRAIFLVGETLERIKMLGIIHPSGAIPAVSNDELFEIGRHIKKHVQ